MKNFLLGLAVFGILFCGVPGVHAQAPLMDILPQQYEHILNFSSNITIEDSGSLLVKETIRVYANGETIRHGIYRDFPTTYHDQLGNAIRVGFRVISVARDGRDEPFSIEDRSNGKRVYAGDANVLLNPGTYEYTLTYSVDRELGFFKDHDELYWNVTGNGWAYSIDSASAVVQLPSTIPLKDVTTAGYTGAMGSKEQAYTATVQSNGIHFTATRTLSSGEGLTIVVGWPKGYITEPTTQQKIWYFFRDNGYILIALGALFGVLAYYLLMWLRFGLDPKRGTIVAHYEPSQGLSPAAVRSLTRIWYDKKVLSAAILSMAVKGFLKITDDEGDYILTKIATDNAKLSDEEREVGERIFAGSTQIELTQANHSVFERAERSLKKSLEKTLAPYVVKNGWYLGVGIALSVVATAITLLVIPAGAKSIALFMTFWLSIWTVGTFGLLYQVVMAWKNRTPKAIFLTLFSIPFIAGEVFGIGMLVTGGGVVYGVFLLVLITINIGFVKLIPRRTPQGRALQDQIEGFKLFLSVTEKNRLNFHNPPERTPELFEKFLPYALALGVEQKWAEQFTTVFETMEQQGRAYRPMWYGGPHFVAASVGLFASTFSNSFNSAISSSSTPPGSSSGGGGGGSSGGGGGGGGGGGW